MAEPKYTVWIKTGELPPGEAESGRLPVCASA